jgi:hypothetical protein
VFGDANGYTGYLERGLAATAHWATCDRSSDTFANFNVGVKRFGLLGGGIATDAICEYGSNDIYGGGRSLAQMQAAAIAAWGKIAALGIGRIWQCTITPRTTSSDGWTTTANQAVVGAGTNNTVRIGFNDWMRAGAPLVDGAAVVTGTPGALLAGEAGHPLAGRLDIADIAETSRNSGIWKVTGGAWTADGTHPLVLGNEALKAGIVIPPVG